MTGNASTPKVKQTKPLSRKVALALLLVATALTMVSFPQSRLVSACDGSEGSGCSQVIGGPWSYWLAVLPVQWAGLALYIGLAATAWRIFPSSSSQRRIIHALCGAIIGAMLWFGFVQAWVLKQFCPLCVTIHLCAGLAAAFLLSATKGNSSSPVFGFRSVFVGTLATLSLLAVGSPWVIEPQDATRSVVLSQSSERLVEKRGDDLALLAGTSHLAAASLPRLGPAEAKHTAVMNRTAKLAAYLMWKHRIPLSRVVPHYHWARAGTKPVHKPCPHFLMNNGRPGAKWTAFQRLVQSQYQRLIAR